MSEGIATYVIDYPEARLALEYIRARSPVRLAGSFEPLAGQLSVSQMPVRSFAPEPFIVINGSGSHHEETVPLVRGFLSSRPAERFGYVQIDAHPDKEIGYRWMVGCERFVGCFLETPQIESVHLVGLNMDALLPDDYPSYYTRKLYYYRARYFEKLRQYFVHPTKKPEVFFEVTPEELERARANPSVRKVVQSRKTPPGESGAVDTLSVYWRHVGELDVDTLPELPIYLSIDLDVARARPVTDWKRAAGVTPPNEYGTIDNQGDMEWPDLLDLVARIGGARKIAAADICGLTRGAAALPAPAKVMSLDAMAEIYEAVRAAMA